ATLAVLASIRCQTACRDWATQCRGSALSAPRSAAVMRVGVVVRGSLVAPFFWLLKYRSSRCVHPCHHQRAADFLWRFANKTSRAGCHRGFFAVGAVM